MSQVRFLPGALCGIIILQEEGVAVNEDDDFDDDDLDGQEDLAADQVIGYLLSTGAAEWDGMDESGERIFKFNMPLLMEIMPGMYDAIMEDVDSVMLDLFNRELVEVEYDENLDAIFHISPEGKEILKEYGFDYFYPDNEK